MPAPNPARRDALADAAIHVLASGGMAALTHRGVDQAAGVPAGTTSNYFRTRESLLIGLADRLVEIRVAAMDAWEPPTAHESHDSDGILVAVLAAALKDAATIHRDQYRAALELQLEASRRPALASRLAQLFEATVQSALHQHREAHLGLPADGVQLVMTLLGGAILRLVSEGESGDLDATCVRLATAIVRGAGA